MVLETSVYLDKGLPPALAGELPGSPDLVFPARRKAIFVHGCFWHRHEGCSRASAPSSNVRYWRKKLGDNVQRDILVSEKLRSLGWAVLKVWECETQDLKEGDVTVGWLCVNPFGS